MSKLRVFYYFSKFLLIASLIRLFRKLSTILAQKAVPKLPMEEFGARLKEISKTIAFTTSENIPRVTIVIGRDNTFKIGLIVIFTSANIIAMATIDPAFAK